MSPEERARPFRRETAQPLTLEVIWYDGAIIDEMTVPATSRYSTRPKVEDRAAARPRRSRPACQPHTPGLQPLNGPRHLCDRDRGLKGEDPPLAGLTCDEPGPQRGIAPPARLSDKLLEHFKDRRRLRINRVSEKVISLTGNVIVQATTIGDEDRSSVPADIEPHLGTIMQLDTRGRCLNSVKHRSYLKE